MGNAPRIWLDYRPVRIGWVVAERDIAPLVTAARWNTCLWGGRYNCVVPIHDKALADAVVEYFGVDVLLPVQASTETAAYIGRFPHLQHHRWRDGIFHKQECDFADIRHALRRVRALQDRETPSRLALAGWEKSDALQAMLALWLGRYPAADPDVPDYETAIRREFTPAEISIASSEEIPVALLERYPPLGITAYDLTCRRGGRWWMSPGIVVGSAGVFDDLAAFWNLRATGAQLIFYDGKQAARLKSFANAWLARLSDAGLGGSPRLNIWKRGQLPPRDESWKPDLEFGKWRPCACGGGEGLWREKHGDAHRPSFTVRFRDVVTSHRESNGRESVTFALPDRPFSDDDIDAHGQKFVVVVDAARYGEPDGELTFETPFVPRLNEFYGRNFHYEYDAARSQRGRLRGGTVAIIAPISTQQLQVNAFPVFDWMKEFFGLCGMEVARSEAGLRGSRVIAQMGGVQGGRVFKIRGVRKLLRKYGVDEHFTRSGAIAAIRDVDPDTGAVGFDAFKGLFIEARENRELKPDDVLSYLLKRRVFRVGLELLCPNCRLPGWVHLDEVKSRSSCGYCDHVYDVTPQLKDRDWRYRRSGIFGRDDHQAGGVPVALTLQQLDTSLHQNLRMYSTAMTFRPAGGAIEPCESDLVAVVSGGAYEWPVQIVFNESKTEGSIDAQDVRKLGKLADAVPSDLAQAFILFSKTGTFSPDEVALARTLNGEYRRRVILWSGDELEPYFLYERSKERLGGEEHAVSLSDMANATHRLYFA